MITKNIIDIKYHSATISRPQWRYILKYKGNVTIGQLMLQFVQEHKKVIREKIIGYGYGEDSFEIEYEDRIEIYTCITN